MADEQFQVHPALVGGLFEQGEAVDGGAMDGDQIGVVGLVAGVGGLAELLGGEGMDEADLEAAFDEGVLGNVMVAAGPLDGDDDVLEVMLLHGSANLGDHGLQFGAVVADDGGRDEQLAVEVGELPFGAELGAIDADDAKVFGSDLLDARVDDAAGLLHELGRSLGPLAGMSRRHEKLPPGKKSWEYPNSPSEAVWNLN